MGMARNSVQSSMARNSVQSVKLSPMWHACNSKATVRCGTKNRPLPRKEGEGEGEREGEKAGRAVGAGHHDRSRS